jgi:hypothetical protein
LNSLGISFSGKYIRFVGINSAGEPEFIKEAETDLDFSEDLAYFSRNSAIIGSISEIIRESLSGGGPDSGTISFSIDTNNAFLNVIPVDFSETPQNVKSRIIWDLSNYFPDSYKNYRLNYIRLNDNRGLNNISSVLLIAVHNNLNSLFQKIFSEAGLKIKVFDIDQLAVINAVNGLSPSGKDSILIGCRKNRIDISVTRKNKISAYTYLLYKDVDFERSLRNELVDISLDAGAPRADIFVYGDEIAGFAADIAKSVTGANVSFIDLYSHGKNLDPAYKDISYKFAAAYGLALKGLNPA